MANADYLIIGAGSAGCVLAARLSEDPQTRVTLLEAGPQDRNLNIRIPAAFPKLFHNRKLDWDLETEPEPGCEGRRLYMPRGKMLGGSSSMNAMLYVRGRPLDYDLWVRAGAEGWGWDDVLPYFLRAEHNERGASEFHATGGPLNVADQRSPRPLARELIAACEAAGIPYAADCNGPEQDGVSMFQVTQRNGRRWSTADAYLRPATKRPNLEVITGAHVLALELDRERVTGARYRDGRGQEQRIRAEREVILSAGAIGSRSCCCCPASAPPASSPPPACRRGTTSPASARTCRIIPSRRSTTRYATGTRCTGPTSPRQLAEWLLRRSGKLTSTVAEVCAFVRTRSGLPAADIQLHMGAAYFEEHGSVEFDGACATIAPTLVSPRSRGEVTLRSADPAAKPKILTNALTEPDDVASMVAGMRLAREIAATAPLRDTIIRELTPGPDVTDADLEQSLRRRVELIYHPVGTCAMGSGESAVLDPELRVRGLTGLRVVDASVFPVIPGGNTNAPTIMVAERAADLIRGLAPAR